MLIETLSIIFFLVFSIVQVEIVCEPNIDGDGGIPAGCQVDKEGNLYVADMRLGILYVKPDGTFTQVMSSSLWQQG